ncbi:hypothetical protein GCK72_021659 [Caenorhabditis remanei]|uniref:C-type lectin domain-containing protein n=1 Tax=Caenorhabditis remanei TaxID=31234 RepID=A0A6A5GKG6_CAERE|nr:hypothetical protein GCK72_021659 [Caenorhabditis remanei]KAF1755091.1 hypothetical protein GCK72_021659 [Caenorhabditis remanei]
MINRISIIYAERQARRRPVQNEAIQSDNEIESAPEPEGEAKTEFEPAEKQRHFGILQYTMNNRFRKIMLIGLANVLLIVAFFLFMFFFVVKVKCAEPEATTTLPPSTTTMMQGSTTPAGPPLKYTCTDGFELVFGKCWQINIDLPGHQEAERICNTRGSTLFTIKSELEDQAFRNWMNHRHHRSWMGLTCDGPDNTTCVWDDGEKWPFSYVAFEDGSPANDCCFQYNISGVLGKQWTCDNCGLALSYVCELPQTIAANCTNNFNMHCYNYYSQPMSLTDAQDYCRDQNGNLLSIQSRPENIFVQAIQEINNDYIWLGGVSKDSIPSIVEERTIVEVANGVSRPDFEPMERQRHFGILRYNMNNRFHKVMLIGLMNVVLIVIFFLFMFFFVVKIKCSGGEGYATVPPTEPSITKTTSSGPLLFTCPDGYDLVGTNCLQLYTTPLTWSDARDRCHLSSSLLLMIKTQQEDQDFRAYIHHLYNRTWLGLTCTKSDKTSCKWDDLLQWPFPYSAFADGSPNGGCLFYNVSDTLGTPWVGGYCDQKLVSVCITSSTPESKCKNNFESYCYYYYSQEASFSEAQDFCKLHCGNLVSVLSEDENNFLLSMDEIKNDSIYLGGLLATENKIMWADGSKMLYNNTVEYNKQDSCLIMKMGSNGGNWTSTTCSKTYSYVCKVSARVSCSV